MDYIIVLILAATLIGLKTVKNDEDGQTANCLNTSVIENKVTGNERTKKVSWSETRSNVPQQT
jgi:hypothetical protein